MTLLQLLQAIQTKIRAMRWGATSNVVFATDSVRITVGTAPDAVFKLRMPVALISPQDCATDPRYRNEPGLLVQRVTVTLIVAVKTDQFGESPLVGANIANDDKSAGKGLLQLETELFAAIELLTQDEGINIQFLAASQVSAAIDDQVGYIATRGYAFEAVITTTESA